MKVEGGAHPEEDCRVQLLAIVGHEPLLLRGAQPYPKEVRLERPHEARQVLFFLGRQRPEGRGVSASDLEPGEPVFEPALEFFRYARCAAVKEMRQAPGLAVFTYPQHQVRAIDPCHRPEALPATHPHHRHAIRRGEEGAVENRTKVRVKLGLADPMHARHTDVAFGSALQRLRHRRHCQV